MLLIQILIIVIFLLGALDRLLLDPTRPETLGIYFIHVFCRLVPIVFCLSVDHAAPLHPAAGPARQSRTHQTPTLLQPLPT